MLNRRVAATFLLLPVVLLAFASSAAAQKDRGIGALAGVSGDPGQFYFGGHLDLKEIHDKFWFRPNAEIGVGDGMVLMSLNGEFAYFLKGKAREWMPFVGAGPAFVGHVGYSGNTSGVGPGLNFVVGIEERRGLLVEIKIGAFDSPGFKAGIGWSW